MHMKLTVPTFYELWVLTDPLGGGGGGVFMFSFGS